MGKRWVSCDDWSFLTSSSSNNPIGDTHQRQKRAMTPAFGPVEAKALLPCVMDSVNKANGLRLHRVLKADSGPCH